MMIWLPLLLNIIPAQQSAPAKPAPTQDIVVTGQLAASERALADCIARGCSPADDIKAALRHAENQFIEGEYKKALATLRAASGRTRGRRDEVPGEYADLMRATAQVGRHLGDDRVLRTGALEARQVLANNRPKGDPLLLAVSLEAGDMFLRTGYPDAAEAAYREVQARAAAAGLRATEGAAMLRLISLCISQANRTQLGAVYLRKARGIVGEIAANPAPAFRRFDPVARLMVARLAAELGDDSELEAAIAAYSRDVAPVVPVLASGQKPKLNTAMTGAPDIYTLANTSAKNASMAEYEPLTDARAREPSQDFQGQWVDIGFWVRPDGRVEDVAILRKSKRLSGGWEVPVLKSVESRRYTPLALDAASPGLLRIERYTYTAQLERITGTRLMGRSPQTGRIAMVDLSPVAKH